MNDEHQRAERLQSELLQSEEGIKFLIGCVVTVHIQWLEMFAQKSWGVQVRGSLYPHMILSDLGPRSNTCPDDWHFSLITGQPHNRKHLPELLLSMYSKPQADMQLSYVNYSQQSGQQLLYAAPNLISRYLSCIYDFYVSFGILGSFI